MTKLSFGAHPFLLGFEQLERLVERTAKSGAEGYPPYNIEAVTENETIKRKALIKKPAMPVFLRLLDAGQSWLTYCGSCRGSSCSYWRPGRKPS